MWVLVTALEWKKGSCRKKNSPFAKADHSFVISLISFKLRSQSLAGSQLLDMTTDQIYNCDPLPFPLRIARALEGTKGDWMAVYGRLGNRREKQLCLVQMGDRITELRKTKGWNQTELAKKIGVSYTQMSRYEIRGVQPPANTLKKLADVFDTTVDYLVSGDKDEKVKASLKDAELLQQFKAVEQFTMLIRP